MVDSTKVLGKNQFFVDKETSDKYNYLYVGDGETELKNLEYVRGDGGADLPPNDNQVYGMRDKEWVSQALVDEIGNLHEVQPHPDAPTAEDAVIGYIIGPARSVNGADIYLCDYEGNILEQPSQNWFDSHLPWSGMVDVADGANSMIKVPRYWYKSDTQPEGKTHAGNPRFMISSFELDGFKCDGSVFKNSAGEWQDYFLIGKYRARNVSNVGISQSTGNPWSSIQNGNLNSAIKLNGSNYHLMSYQEWCTILQLCVIEKATFQLYPESIRQDPSQCVYRGIQEFCLDARGISGRTEYVEWVSGIQTNSVSLLLLSRDPTAPSWMGIVLPIPMGSGGYIGIIDRNHVSIENYFLSSSIVTEGNSMIPDYFYIAAGKVGYINFMATDAYYGSFSLRLSDTSSYTSTAISGRPASVGS